ncbi:MBL fold metallo-hydrolase [Devosia sp. LjRoot16]|uniref:MBL fold metallo-hydrolase n=1 Tax=Devosia sp. LjRoot16 TaxID=3342271 RepID=UPI003ECF7496
MPSKTDIVREPLVPKLRVSHINDYLICFYDGRDIADYPEWIKGNIDMKLGVCNYVLHRGDSAIVFDTMVYGEQMEAIDAYIREMGIKHVSVINSHWDCDHIAGNYLYKNADIIATNRTRWKLQAYAPQMLSGEIWGAGDPNYPGVKEVVLPNRTFDGRMTVWLKDLQIELIETFVHQLGHLVAYLPKDKILLAADAVEDTVTFNTPAMTSEIAAQIMTYRSLLAMDARSIYPCHGRFEVIDNGGYTQEFTEAILDYNVQLLKRKDEPDYLTAPLESFIQPWIDRGVLAMHEPYRWLHGNNVSLIDKSYGGRSTPAIPE